MQPCQEREPLSLPGIPGSPFLLLQEEQGLCAGQVDRTELGQEAQGSLNHCSWATYLRAVIPSCVSLESLFSAHLGNGGLG